MKGKKKNRFIAALILVFVAVLIGVVLVPSWLNHAASTKNKNLVGENGGFQIQSERMSFCVYVDGLYKYYRFMSDADRVAELYIAPTEMIMVDTTDGKTMYYREKIENNQAFVNPLEWIISKLGELDFQLVDDPESGSDCEVYQAENVVETVKYEDVEYSLYTLAMDWIDDKHYIFQYYDYVDGSVMITAEAPIEINPLVIEDTKWVVDVDELRVYNTESGESVSLNLIATTTGKGPTPSEADGSVVTEVYHIQLYFNPEKQRAEKMQYVRDDTGTEILFLYDFDIPRPEFMDGMAEMTYEEAEMLLTLMSLLENSV